MCKMYILNTETDLWHINCLRRVKCTLYLVFLFSMEKIYISQISKDDLKVFHVSQFWACIHYRYMILFSIHSIFVYIWFIVVWIVVSLVINIANQHYPDIPLRVNEDWQMEHLKGLELLWTCVWPWRLCILPNSLSEKKGIIFLLL